MTEHEYTDAKIDKLADAGDYWLEEQGFKYRPSRYDLHKVAMEGERLLGQCEGSHNQSTVKHWSVRRQPGGLWEIRLNGKLYIENGKAAIFRTQEEAHCEVNSFK